MSPAASPALGFPEPEAARVEPQFLSIGHEMGFDLRGKDDLAAHAATRATTVSGPDLHGVFAGKCSFVDSLADESG